MATALPTELSPHICHTIVVATPTVFCLFTTTNRPALHLSVFGLAMERMMNIIHTTVLVIFIAIVQTTGLEPAYCVNHIGQPALPLSYICILSDFAPYARRVERRGLRTRTSPHLIGYYRSPCPLA